MSHIFEIAQLFFKLGCFAFGGPVAHIAMMEDECVQKRKWMSHEEFLDLIGVTNLIPGPNSTEMAMHVGYLRGGMLGLIVAGVCFITPAAVLTGILTYLYITFNYLPEFDAVFYGIRAGILVIILQAVLKLGKKAVTTRLLGVIGIASMGLSLYGMNEVLALLMSGLVGTVWLYGNKKFFKSNTLKVASLPLFLVFLKVGSILFGSGYVLIAYLQGELIDSLGWLTQQQLLDAIAIGQMTPGPILTTATCVGFQLAGVAGAVYATLGMFLPSFVFVMITSPFIKKIRKSNILGCFLDAINVAAVGIMVSVLFQLTRISVVDVKTTLIAVVMMVYVFCFKKPNILLIIPVSGLLGYLFSLV